MKSLCISIFVLLFLPNAWAQCVEDAPELARLSPAMIGSVPVAAGCVSPVDLYATSAAMNDIWGDATTGGAWNSVNNRYATKFTTTATVTVTDYRLWASTDGANDTFTVTCELRTDDGGPSPTDGETNYIEGTRVSVAVDTGVWSTTAAERTFTLAAPKTGLTAGTYWIVCGLSAYTDGYMAAYRDDAVSGGTGVCTSTNAATTYTFGSQTADRVNPKAKIYGCVE